MNDYMNMMHIIYDTKDAGWFISAFLLTNTFIELDIITYVIHQPQLPHVDV